MGKVHTLFILLNSRATNFEEMLEGLKAQLNELDFIQEYDRAQEENDAFYGEEYYLEDPGDLRLVPSSPNPAIGDDFISQKSSPEFNYQQKQKSSRKNPQRLQSSDGFSGSPKNNLMRIREQESDTKFGLNRIQQFKEDDVGSENSDEFLRGLGFKDPFHRELMSTEGTD